MFANAMENVIKVLQKNLSGLRTGRASPALLEDVMVEAYGGKTPLNQLGNVSAPEARVLLVQVWDQSIVKAVEKSIKNSHQGLSIAIDGSGIRIFLPEITGERRKELVKKAKEYAEEARVSVRLVRRDAMECIAKLENDKKCSEDEKTHFQKETQDLTDEYNHKIEKILAEREKDILTV